MSKRVAKPRGAKGGGAKRSRNGSRNCEDSVEERESFHGSQDEEPPPSPPPGFEEFSNPIASHRYATRQAKSLFKSCVSRAPLNSSSPRQALRVLPESHSLDVKPRTMTSNFVTSCSRPIDEVNCAISSTVNGAENETNPNTALSTRSDNLNFTEILLHASCDNEEEVNSAPDPSRVDVGGYRVKAETAPLLEKIFAKYGDIVKDCTFQSVEHRSSFLECVCDIFQNLDDISLVDITSGELKAMLVRVKDLEHANVKIDWLCCRLEKISEAKELMKGGGNKLKESKMKRIEEIKEKNKEMLKTKRELDAYLDACQLLQEKLNKLQQEVGIAHGEVEKFDGLFSDAKAKVKCFYKQSLVHSLL